MESSFEEGPTFPLKTHLRNIWGWGGDLHNNIYRFCSFCNQCEPSLDLAGLLLTLLSALPVGLQFTGFFTASPHWSQYRAKPIKFYHRLRQTTGVHSRAGSPAVFVLYLDPISRAIIKNLTAFSICRLAKLDISQKCVFRNQSKLKTRRREFCRRRAHSDYCSLKFVQTKTQCYFQEFEWEFKGNNWK